MWDSLRFRQNWFLVLSLSLTVFPGCGGAVEGPPRASVSGSVTIGGKPIAGVEVHFQNPDFPNHGSFAVTDADGKFRLVQGAAVGMNKVFFSKVEGDQIIQDPESGMDAGQMEAMAAGNESDPGVKIEAPKQLVPPEYNSSASKLTFDVPAGGTSSAVFEL